MIIYLNNLKRSINTHKNTGNTKNANSYLLAPSK